MDQKPFKPERKRDAGALLRFLASIDPMDKKPGKKGENWPVLIAFIIICNLAGAIGSLFTIPAIPGWYASLSKPSFSPPSWLFGPVWTILYVLMGISAYLVWRKGWQKKPVRAALALFALQLFLNALWSILFFGLRSPLYGLAGIAFLWLSILLAMRAFYAIDRRAAYLLLPYIAWVSFAALLNY